MKSYTYIKPNVVRVTVLDGVDETHVCVRDESGCMHIVPRDRLRSRADLVMQQVWDDLCTEIKAVTTATGLSFYCLPGLTWGTPIDGLRHASTGTGTYSCQADDKHWHITFADKNHPRARTVTIYDGNSLSDGFKRAEMHHAVACGCIKL